LRHQEFKANGSVCKKLSILDKQVDNCYEVLVQVTCFNLSEIFLLLSHIQSLLWVLFHCVEMLLDQPKIAQSLLKTQKTGLLYSFQFHNRESERKAEYAEAKNVILVFS
jgi:hypothetical protein